MNDTSEEGFIGRWSRRKRTGEEAASDTEVAIRSDADGPVEADLASDAEDEARQVVLAANREAAEAVDIEAIGYESDLSVFFKEGVPALLKQAAMRKMWRSDPVFANVDGLNDYDQDFNVIDKVLTEFKSAWQVGRGYAEPEKIEPEPDADIADGDEAVAESAAGEEDEPDAESAGAADDAGTEQIADTGNEDDVVVAGSAAHGPRSVPEIDTALANGSENPKILEDVRPTVSLRRRMAFFDDDQDK